MVHERLGVLERPPVMDMYDGLREKLSEIDNLADLEKERLVFDKFASEQIGLAPTPGAQQVLSVYGKILEWQLYGQPGDPLPDGIIKVTDRSGYGVRFEED